MSSYFWRNPLQQQILLGLLRGMYDPAGTVRILDVGCSSGEMLLSYAMLLADEYGEDWHERFAITAVDHDAEKIEQFRRGIWPENRIYQMPKRYRDRFFRTFDLPGPKGSRVEWAILKSIALIDRMTICCAAFEDISEGDLPWDVVHCQNTLLHLPAGDSLVWIDRIAGLLRPGGLFFCAGHHGEKKTAGPNLLLQLERQFEAVPHNVVAVYEGWLQRKHAADPAIQLRAYDPHDPKLPYRIGSIFRRRLPEVMPCST